MDMQSVAGIVREWLGHEGRVTLCLRATPLTTLHQKGMIDG